jgi:hypothetical protein
VSKREQIKETVRNLIRRQLLTGRFPSSAHSYAPVTGREAVVLMCLWNRPSRLPEILERLDGQDFPDGVRLYLWNNNRRDRAIYKKALAEHRSTGAGALHQVDLVTSVFNVGSIARFYWARRLALKGYTGPVIVLDDDQNFESSFVSTAFAHYDPRALTSWWAFTIHGAYWQRAPAVPGGDVDYAGTGGMICNSDIFLDADFFTTIPGRFWMIDDMWLNYFATGKGYTLRKLPVHIEAVMEETNQYHHQVELKEEFYRLLYPAAASSN